MQSKHVLLPGEPPMVAAALRALSTLLLVMVALMPVVLGHPQAAQAFARPAPAPKPAAATGRLQEVAPPGAVQQLQERLQQRQPRVTIISPKDDSLMAAGPVELVIGVDDWPLVDAGPLGLGPHLVVQLDDQAPIRITEGRSPLRLELPALSPGSHRVSAYAAKPWGEAAKAPAASTQILLHRVAANPASQPSRGSTMLLPVSPGDLTTGDPVLIDWLLFNAPLQHLRDGDDRWRLRLTINGDSVQVDRTTPLWLKGLRIGSNAVQFELLDPAGEPLNPPFNSLVREALVEPAQRSAWQGSRLSDQELAILLGLTAAEPETFEQEQIEPLGVEAKPSEPPSESPSNEEFSEPQLPQLALESPPEPEPSAAEPELEQTTPSPAAMATPSDTAELNSRPLSPSAQEPVVSDDPPQQPEPRGLLGPLRARFGP